jgi:archaellum component FlaG (FlaF/FlaG flagellin family)
MNRSTRLILFITLILMSLQVAPVLVADTLDVTKSQTSGGTNATHQAAPPNIMIPDPLFTFDAVVDGTEVVHDFRVYNRGTGGLIIEKVQTG